MRGMSVGGGMRSVTEECGARPLTGVKIPLKARRGRPPKGMKSPEAIQYARIRAAYPMLPKKLAKRAAGYSEHTDTSSIEGSKSYLETVEKQREIAVRNLAISVESQLKPLIEIRDGKDEQSADRIRAIQVANGMLPGFTAPEERRVSIKGLFVELKNTPTGDIAQFLEECGG
jgi:hypothetical protein